ncbi:hypothetical protein AMECASPLE_018919 [Ameca splendens]|uniref:Uncharacterized protein n=1 Tax=Ameca splendens TaxID=208324 RepID=A0ABV0ZNS5_9TELE
MESENEPTAHSQIAAHEYRHVVAIFCPSISEIGHQNIYWPRIAKINTTHWDRKLYKRERACMGELTGDRDLQEKNNIHKNLDSLTHPPAALSSNLLPELYLFSLPPSFHTSFLLSIMDGSLFLTRSLM